MSRGKMFGSVGLKVNGKVFAMLVKGSLVVKLHAVRVEELVRAGDGQYFDPGHGRRMKQWVSVPNGEGRWISLAKEAHAFVRGDVR